MHSLNVVGIKLVRRIVPLAQKVLTPKQPPPPKPSTTAYIPSPAIQPSSNGDGGKNQTESSTAAGEPQPSSPSSPSGSGGKSSAQKPRRHLKADIYLPATSDAASSPPRNAVLPIVINLHGSGFCFHAHGEDARFCSQLATSLPAVVIDVDYSHAPEHPWPAAVEDVDATIAWARTFAREGRKSRQKFGGGDVEWEWDERRIALTGFSSGANLALIGGTRKPHNGGVQAVVAFYPSTNLAESPWDKPQLAPEAGAAGGVMPPWLRYMLYECYVPAHLAPDRKDPNISPLYAAPSSFPPSVTIINCERDSLAREAAQLAERLHKACTGGDGDRDRDGDGDGDRYDGDVTLWTAQGQGHNWDKMTKQDSEPAKMRDEAYRLAVRRIRDAFALVAVGADEMRDDDDDDDDDDDEMESGRQDEA
ncbi:uncharacterized protein PFL1_00099 [Pseudozyma flocculosa PF-1]|uniref:Alpha/beta hydrolase fold-3 domain-containing protein n=1 Tax=Pseudozyma flocculosa TaxID=84751 RepID=A0A5C3EVK8_9BASI|nr:uncharacterized protein PFL1_00099 [Pseudozyma flocculosa PF-1]EPQ31900.1 hypothetical protein PFL1_00099 [Pseudozyma flocculosa PF-1]SPO35189.1 uncharacterized protein PSFLO_00660 [Pseudozyma flocculosa]